MADKVYRTSISLSEASVSGKAGFSPNEAVVTHGVTFLSGTVVLTLRGSSKELILAMLPDDADKISKAVADSVNDYRKRGLM